ncbi:hypothetical protein RF11_04394 [Thelohanellus kitauei]|uniref:RRM domain-containing protein n=1 Tax=Thelohanellus kitauei TaxID=669202 RepID=A0A0C2J180_THEKT|nr:hypothetical protein RF11_04394 [Thelohanellus kitauei]
MIKNQFDQYGTHSSTNPSLEANEAPNDPLVGVPTDGGYNNGTSVATVMPVDPIVPHQKNLVMKNVPDKYIPSIIKTNDTNDISKDIQECLMAYKKGAFQDLLEIHYGYFVKIFYLDPNMEDDDIVSFVAHICRPIFVMHSYFEGGPHAGKKRGEVFLCFQSTSNAYKCLKLNGSRIGKHKVAIIFPSREEIDSVLCQNAQFYNTTNTQTQEQEEIQMKENTQTKLETTKNEEINPALKLLQTVTESINQNQQRYSLESSMADNIDTSFNEQLFKKMNVEIRSDVVTEAMVRAKNVPNSATLKDMINFFRSVPFVHSSLKKLNSVGDKAEWSLTFKTHKDAIDSINALNYRLIKENPIELEFM